MRLFIFKHGAESYLVSHSIFVGASRWNGNPHSMIIFHPSYVICVRDGRCVLHTVYTGEIFGYHESCNIRSGGSLDIHKYIAFERTLIFVDKFSFIFQTSTRYKFVEHSGDTCEAIDFQEWCTFISGPEFNSHRYFAL